MSGSAFFRISKSLEEKSSTILAPSRVDFPPSLFETCISCFFLERPAVKLGNNVPWSVLASLSHTVSVFLLGSSVFKAKRGYETHSITY